MSGKHPRQWGIHANDTNKDLDLENQEKINRSTPQVTWFCRVFLVDLFLIFHSWLAGGCDFCRWSPRDEVGNTGKTGRLCRRLCPRLGLGSGSFTTEVSSLWSGASRWTRWTFRVAHHFGARWGWAKWGWIRWMAYPTRQSPPKIQKGTNGGSWWWWWPQPWWSWWPWWPWWLWQSWGVQLCQIWRHGSHWNPNLQSHWSHRSQCSKCRKRAWRSLRCRYHRHLFGYDLWQWSTKSVADDVFPTQERLEGFAWKIGSMWGETTETFSETFSETLQSCGETGETGPDGPISCGCFPWELRRVDVDVHIFSFQIEVQDVGTVAIVELWYSERWGKRFFRSRGNCEFLEHWRYTDT